MSLRYDAGISEYGINVLKISYPGLEIIELDLTDLFKDLTHIDTLYTPINEYLETIPEANQRQIYDIFFQLYSNDWKNNFDDQSVVSKIELKVKQVVDLFGYENFKAWIHTQSDRIIYPENILNNYTHDPDMNTTLEKTYVKSEYTDLISLIMVIRTMVPLYVDFYNRIKQVTPHYYYKIFMLFVRSSITNSKEIEKLRTYIDVNQQTLIGATKNENLILIAGLSGDDILDSLLSEVVFNKLLPIDFFNKKCNIISFIFQTIKYKGSYAPSNGQTIRGNTVSSGADKEDNSYFEDYRKTSDLPIGTVVELQHSLSDLNFLLQATGETNFNYEMYNYEMQNIGRYMDFKMDKFQIYLLGWFMDKVINPRAMFYIEYRMLVELMLFAKTVLVSNGHHYMAAIISARKTQEHYLQSVVIKNSMNKESVKRLSSFYKYSMEDEKQSTVEKTMLEMCREIANSTWLPIATPEQLQNVKLTGNWLETPSNINDLVLDYVEFIVKSRVNSQLSNV